MTDPTALAKAYYRTIDAAEYDALADLLAPEFVHERPDRTLSGRDRFVAFIRDERPMTETTHVVETVYDVGPQNTDSAGGDGEEGAVPDHMSGDVAVQGRLLDAENDELFAFVDVFTVSGGQLARLETYVTS